MSKSKKSSFSTNTSEEVIRDMIYIMRGQKVMIDTDLANLYGVPTKILNQSVKRNVKRFPEDFMFQLNDQESDFLRSQNVTSKDGRGGRRYKPFAFTEQGVAMLSGVLNSNRAIQVNIAIMRTFTKLRGMIESHKSLKQRVDKLEQRYDKRFKIVFIALKELLKEPEKQKSKIGFYP